MSKDNHECRRIKIIMNKENFAEYEMNVVRCRPVWCSCSCSSVVVCDVCRSCEN